MMKNLLLIIVMNCFCAGSIMAQQGVFSVILNKGQNSFGTQKGFQPVILGISLAEGDFIKVADGGYVALVHESSGSSLELTEKGNFAVNELESKVLSKPTTVMAKYGKFLMKKLNPDEHGNQNLNVTGAVERGDVGIINVELPKVNDVYGSQVFVSWNQTDDIKDYIITIKDKIDDIIVKKSVIGNSYILDLDQDAIENEKIIIINVMSKNNDELRSPDFGIKRLNDAESKSIGDEFTNLKVFASSNNVVDKILIASFFEENQLLADAITYYNEAQLISPDPDGFNKLYDNFLIRNGLKN